MYVNNKHNCFILLDKMLDEDIIEKEQYDRIEFSLKNCRDVDYCAYLILMNTIIYQFQESIHY